MSSSLFTLTGWETFYHLIRSNVQKDADWAIAFVHWFLVHKAQLGCVWPKSGPRLQPSTEILPDNWNGRPTSYRLRYVSADDYTLYMVTGHLSEDVIIVRMLSNATKMTLSNVQLHIGDTESTVATCAALKVATTPDAQLLIDRLVRELLNPVFRSRLRSSETQTIPERLLVLNRQQNALERNCGQCGGADRCSAGLAGRLGRVRRIGRAAARTAGGSRNDLATSGRDGSNELTRSDCGEHTKGRASAPAVGRKDLDPLAAAGRDRIQIDSNTGEWTAFGGGGGGNGGNGNSGGGGMLYQLPKEMPPIRSDNQPPSSTDSLQLNEVVKPPAGARFDPFGPPGAGSRDHFRLPKFGDRFPD